MIRNQSKKTPLRLLLLSAAVILSGCGQAVTPEPTPDMNAFATSAVQTVEARYTQTAAAVPTETPEADDIIFAGEDLFDEGSEDLYDDSYPEDTAFSSDPVYYSSEYDTGASEPYGETAETPADKGVDKAAWQSQTPADGTHIAPGEEFDIVWNMLNTGTTTWTTGYRLRYFSGTNLTKPGKNYTLASPVAPNTVGACSLDAIAPWAPGTYQMSVVLSNEEDVNFSIVDITIVVD